MQAPKPEQPERKAEADLDALKALDARIERAREKLAPKSAKAWGGGKFAGASLAWRMVIELMVGIALGGAIGWGLDALFGAFPFMTIIFGVLGFVAGVRTMLRSAKEADNSAGRS